MSAVIENVKDLQEWLANNLANGSITNKTELTFPSERDGASFIYFHIDRVSQDIYVTNDSTNHNLRP
jgi:hypothetical protein